MDFAALARTLDGRQLAAEAGGRAELAPFVIADAEGEVRVYPALEEGECVGAVFAAELAEAAEMPRIVLRAEDALDRGGKALGINRELQVGDAEFDGAVYVDSEAPDEQVRRVLADPALRAAARALVRGPAGEVQLGEGRVSVRLAAAQLSDDRLPEVRAMLQQLRALARAMPVPKDMPTRGELVRRRSVGHIYALAAMWLVTLALAVVLAPPLVLAWGSIWAALGLGVGLWLLVCVGLAIILRGAADSLRWVMISAIAFALTTPFAGMKLALLADAALDAGPETSTHLRVEVIERGETRLVVDVAGLVPGEARTRLHVPNTMFVGAWPKDLPSLTFTTRPGALGWPWLVSIGP